METRTINNSEIQAFKQCRRKWMLEYHLGYKKQEESGKLFLGTLVHKGLEYYYNNEDPMKAVEEANAVWYASETALYVPEPSKDIELAEKMLEGYVQWVEETGIDAGLTVVKTEEEIHVDLGIVAGRQIELYGTLDLQLQDEFSNIGLLDHKTVQTFTDFTDRRMQLNEQLLTYALLLRKSKDQKVSWAAINMLRKVKRTGATAKPPFFHREMVQFNDVQLRNHFSHLQGVIGDILAVEDRLKETEFTLNHPSTYPTVSKDCSWKCPFLAICPLVDDGSDIAGALENLYERKGAAA